MGVVIDVTPEDIRAGLRKSPASCPVALALRRAIPRAKAFSVTTSFVEWRVRTRDGWRERTAWYAAETPYEAANFITAFDAGLPVEPISFALSAVPS